MKNIILSIIMTISFITNSFAQNPIVPDTNLQINSEKQDDTFVIQHKDIEINIGTLKISAPFLYQGEITPKQGYIVSIKDTVRIRDVVKGCQSSCDILVKTITESCTNKIESCQKNCDKRVVKITNENESLRKKITSLETDIKKEKKEKIIWSIASTVAGAGLGILVYQITNK